MYSPPSPRRGTSDCTTWGQTLMERRWVWSTGGSGAVHRLLNDFIPNYPPVLRGHATTHLETLFCGSSCSFVWPEAKFRSMDVSRRGGGNFRVLTFRGEPADGRLVQPAWPRERRHVSRSAEPCPPQTASLHWMVRERSFVLVSRLNRSILRSLCDFAVKPIPLTVLIQS